MLKCEVGKNNLEVEMSGMSHEILTDMTLVVARVLLNLIDSGVVRSDNLSINEVIDLFLEDFKHNLGDAMVKLMLADAVEDMLK